jgi:hypothetical protein
LAAAGGDQGGGQHPHVVDAGVLVVVEQRVPARLGRPPVLGDEGQHQPVPVAEVVLHGAGVALPGRPVDLAQQHAVDAVGGEEPLGRGHDRLARGAVGARGHVPSTSPVASAAVTSPVRQLLAGPSHPCERL